MRLFFFALGLVLSCSCLGAKPTRSLEDAGSRIMRHFSKGTLVTAESKGESSNPVFALAGEVPDLKAPPELLPFEIGSLTKCFNALLLSIAVQESRVSLDSTLGQLLEPNLTFKHRSLANINLRELATHRSGLPRLPENLEADKHPENPYRDYDEAKLWSYILNLDLGSHSKKKYAYSNLGSGLLGAVLSKIYGQPWEQLVYKKICNPLGLEHTFVTRSGTALMIGHDGDQMVSGWQLNSLVAAGGLYSCARDLHTFANAFLNPQNTPIAEALQLCQKMQCGDSPSMALGWFIQNFYEETSYEHGGATGGFRSYIQWIPDSMTIRVVLTNQARLAPERILNALIQRPAPPLASPKKPSTTELERYAGSYAVSSEDEFDLIVYRNQLWMKRGNQSFAPLFVHEQPDRFFLKNEPVQIHFEHDSQRVTLFTFESLGRKLKAIRKPSPAFPTLTIKPLQELQSFTGSFRLINLEPIQIRAKDHQLTLKLAEQPEVNFYPDAMAPLEFHSQQPVVKLVFTKDSSAGIQGFLLYQNGQIVPAFRTVESPSPIPKS